MRQKKSLVMAAWFLTALVLLILLVFLLIATDGLAVEVKQGESFESFVVTVSNQSKHTISFVSVVQQANNETKVLGVLPSLQPEESKAFVIPSQSAKVIITAFAPFHRTAQESIFLQPQKPFSVTVEMPSEIKLGQQFELTVKVCNQTQETQITLEESHEQAFFGGQFQTKQLDIPFNECRNASFVFQPSFSGQTSVNFNIKNNNFSEIFEKNLTIKPE